MSAYPTRSARTTGFAPREISVLVNGSVIEQHAIEAAFLWTQRSHAVHAPHYKLKHLAKLDGRLVAHLRGLEVGGPAGWDAARAALARLEPGVLFVAAYLAFGNQDTKQMYQVLQLGLAEPILEGALLSALAWLDPSTVRPALRRLCASQVQAHRRIGLAALIAHHLDADQEIEQATRDRDPMLRALAFRAVGETKRRELLVTAEQGLRDPESICRFWAEWSLALHGDSAAASAAFDSGWSLPALRKAALEVALRCGESNWARGIVRSLAALPAMRRETIQAVGLFGDPLAVPWLLVQLDDPVNARVAGEALSMITGVDLEFLDLTTDPTDEEMETNPEDSELRWPKADAVRDWWAQHRSEFSDAERHLGGQPVSAAGAMHVLREGYQRQRAGAAIELAYRSESGVFPVEARADWQRRGLST